MLTQMKRRCALGPWLLAPVLGLGLTVSPLLADQAAPPAKEPKAPPVLQAPKDQKPDTPDQPANAKAVQSLALSVKLAFMADPRLLPFPIEVDVNGSHVVLSGKIPGEAESVAAATVALGVPGVKSVHNKLEIAKELRELAIAKRDETITASVKERFERSKTLKEAAFEVKTEEGVVLLGGKTRFQVIVLEAAEAARQVPGVKAVRSEAVRIEGGD